jgi:hypothetical protein
MYYVPRPGSSRPHRVEARRVRAICHRNFLLACLWTAMGRCRSTRTRTLRRRGFAATQQRLTSGAIACAARRESFGRCWTGDGRSQAQVIRGHRRGTWCAGCDRWPCTSASVHRRSVVRAVGGGGEASGCGAVLLLAGERASFHSECWRHDTSSIGSCVGGGGRRCWWRRAPSVSIPARRDGKHRGSVRHAGGTAQRGEVSWASTRLLPTRPLQPQSFAVRWVTRG